MQAQSSRLGEKESMPISADDISASHTFTSSRSPLHSSTLSYALPRK